MKIIEHVKKKEDFIMAYLEWVMEEDGYQERLHIPKDIREKASEGQITDFAICRITDLSTGAEVLKRFKITGNQIYVPKAIQDLLENSTSFRIRIF